MSTRRSLGRDGIRHDSHAVFRVFVGKQTFVIRMTKVSDPNCFSWREPELSRARRVKYAIRLTDSQMDW